MKRNNFLKLAASWSEVKELIKETNVELTDDDLNYQEGKEEEFLQELGKKTNKSPDEVKAWIESISSNKGKAS